MFRPKDRLAEIAAAAAAVVGVLGYFATGNVGITVVAIFIGIAALAWSYLDVTR